MIHSSRVNPKNGVIKLTRLQSLGLRGFNFCIESKFSSRHTKKLGRLISINKYRILKFWRNTKDGITSSTSYHRQYSTDNAQVFGGQFDTMWTCYRAHTNMVMRRTMLCVLTLPLVSIKQNWFQVNSKIFPKLITSLVDLRSSFKSLEKTNTNVVSTSKTTWVSMNLQI